MTKKTYHWGNDPAFTSSGVVILDQDRNVVWTKVLDFSVEGYSKTLDQLPLEEFPPSTVVMERYVAYAGAMSKYSEHILMGIGAFLDRTRAGDQLFFRAIDWKVALAKKEAKETAFTNPSTKLDKKFSKAMATHLTGVKFKTDHEADAACLAVIGLRKYYGSEKTV